MTQAMMRQVVADGDVLEGWGVHNCCCDHLVEQLMAAPSTIRQEQYRAVREKYFDCPHHWLTPLEVYLGTLV
jgi:hypothetical protein